MMMRRSMRAKAVVQQLEGLAALLVSRCQIWRLACDRVLQSVWACQTKPRVLATACWAFPIYSQTFVYQELAHLVRQGFSVRFLYAHQDSRDYLPSAFSCLWQSRRRLILHGAVCDRDYAYFGKRCPEKVEMLVELLAAASGMERMAIRNHPHVRQAFAFARMVEAYRPDYLHSYFFYEGTLFTFVASYLLGIPRGVSCYADHVLKDYELKVVPLHLKQCNVVVATSHRIKEELMRLAPGVDVNRILVKPNAVDAAPFEPKINTDPAGGEPFRLVCACRIEPKKGLVYLVEAMATLRQRGRRVELHLLGAADDNSVSREYAREVDARIGQLGLEQIVHREGRKTGDDVRACFSRSHLFIAPFIETDTGDKDGIPTVLLEAMAAGLPVVATDAGSITEVIDDGTDGILVRQRDPKAMADAIERLLNDESARATIARRALEKVRAHFDVSVCEPPFHQRIRSILGSRSIRPASGGRAQASAPLVSVIVPFLNAEKFLWDAIESVMLQTYDRWELILVDDGSIDSSSNLAQRCAARFPGKVIYLEHEGHQNRGTAASRNAGIQRSSGAYVAPLDADDVWFSSKLEQQVAILEANPQVGMVYGASRYWYGWTTSPADRARDSVPEFGVEPDRTYCHPELLSLLYPLGKGTSAPPSDILLRRGVIERVGGFVEDFRGIYQLYEDQFFLTKVYLHEDVFVSSNCWDLYRIHPESCMAKVTGAGQYEQVRGRFLERFASYLVEQDIGHPMIWQAVQEAQRACQRSSTVVLIGEVQDGRDPGRSGSPSHSPAHQADVVGQPPLVGRVEWGGLRRVEPVSRYWGLDRGTPIDRYYIERFLTTHAGDIEGRVVEIEDNTYTKRFGGSRVTQSDAIHVKEGHPGATITADLTQADHIPSNSFDCFIVTQTLMLIYETRAALRTIHRILKPGGVVLATVAGITQIGDPEWAETWYWSFTKPSARRLFAEAFGAGNVQVQSYGNVLSATAFLQGLVVADLTPEELDVQDSEYEVTVAIRAVKESIPA